MAKQQGVLAWLTAIDPQNSLHAPDALTIAALLYIALPNLIFLAGWVQLPYAVAALVLVLTALWQFISRAHWKQQPYSATAILIILAVAFLWGQSRGSWTFFLQQSRLAGARYRLG